MEKSVQYLKKLATMEDKKSVLKIDKILKQSNEKPQSMYDDLIDKIKRHHNKIKHMLGKSESLPQLKVKSPAVPKINLRHLKSKNNFSQSSLQKFVP